MTTTTRAGTVLMGGGDPGDNAHKWFADRAAGGDMLVLRASGDDAYNPYFKKVSSLNSAETVLFNSHKAATDPVIIDKVNHAEAIWFAGGDQGVYLADWAGTPLMAAIDAAIARGVPVGGTSAGNDILGSHIFSTPVAFTSQQAMRNPYQPNLRLSEGMLHVPYMHDVLTDAHFSQRDRLGRLITSLSRLVTDGKVEKGRGVGVDEDTAMLIDKNGIGTVSGDNKVYIVETTQKPKVCKRGQPLSVSGVRVLALSAGDHFDFRTWRSNDGAREEAFVERGVLRREPR